VRLVDRVLSTPGAPIEDGVRRDMERSFDRDFSSVRVHRDDDAARSAAGVGADAYTVGSHVVFGGGRYEPGSAAGRRLLAHELAHTVQQGMAEPSSGELSLGPPGGEAEAEAARAAGAVSRGEPAAPGPAAAVSGAGRVVQRVVTGDVRTSSVDESFARALTDDELTEQLRIVRAALAQLTASGPESAGLESNQAVLEREMHRRARPQRPPARASTPATAASTPPVEIPPVETPAMAMMGGMVSVGTQTAARSAMLAESVILGEGMVSVGGAALGEGAVLAGAGTTAVVGGTVVTEGAVVAGGVTVLTEAAVVTGGTTVAATTAAGATAVVGGTAAGGTTAAVGTTAGVLSGPVGWIIIGVVVLAAAGIAYYLATREPDVQAPGPPGGAPVTEPTVGPPVVAPGEQGRAPVVEPSIGPPVSLPSDRPPERVEASGDDARIRRNVERLEDMERSGGVPWGDPVALRERLRSADEATRLAAERELAQLEDAVRRMRGDEPEPTPVSVPFNRETAFEEVMRRYPAPLNAPPYNGHPRSHYEPIGWESENSDVPNQVRRVLVIRGLVGDVLGRILRFSVAYDELTESYEDIHQSSR
jgi:hypothetical protein